MKKETFNPPEEQECSTRCEHGQRYHICSALHITSKLLQQRPSQNRSNHTASHSRTKSPRRTSRRRRRRRITTFFRRRTHIRNRHTTNIRPILALIIRQQLRRSVEHDIRALSSVSFDSPITTTPSLSLPTIHNPPEDQNSHYTKHFHYAPTE